MTNILNEQFNILKKKLQFFFPYFTGYTGDGEKSSWIKTELNFDWAFNYKTQDLSQTLKIAAPGKKIFKCNQPNLT